MKVVKVATFGGPEGLIIEEVKSSEVSENQVTIAVEAVGVGRVDLLMRKGLIPAFSSPGFVLGVEVAGTVIKVGEKVNQGWLGQKVFALTPSGGYAEEVTVDCSSLVCIPQAIKPAEAIALGVNALVAEFSLRRAACSEGQSVLIRGAGGGIGSVSVQLALLKGAIVTAITSSEDKQQKLAVLPVKNIIRNKQELSNSFDIIIDPVAGPGLQEFIEKLSANGRYILNGAAAGMPDPSFASAMVYHFQKSLTISALSLSSIASSELAKTMTYLLDLAADGKITPVVSESYSLSQVAEAHRRLESGEVFGKIILMP